MIRQTTLSNGFRIVTERMPALQSAAEFDAGYLNLQTRPR